MEYARALTSAAFVCFLCAPLLAADDIESITPLGQLVRECTLPGETRQDDVVPRHANAIQVSQTRWLLIYSTHGYRGVDDERSIIYQVRRDGPDGALLREGFVARGLARWKPPGAAALPEGKIYYKQHGHMVAFGVPKGAMIGGKPAANANLFVVKWRVSGRVLDVKSDFMPFEGVDRAIGQGVEWMQCRLNAKEDDIEIVQAAAPLRQKGFETGEAFCSANVKRMNESFCPPVAASADFTEWADCATFDGNRIGALKYRFNPQTVRYEWVETGPLLGGDPKRSLSEPSLARVAGGWIAAIRGRGEIAWAKSKNPFVEWSPLVFTNDPPGWTPLTVFLCPDGMVRLLTNDSRVVPTRHIRDPLFVWDVDVDHEFATSNRREIFSVAAGKLPIRHESNAKIDFPELFPVVGRTQLIVHGVSMRAMNHPTEGAPDIPIQNAEEKNAAGLYYERITYHKAPAPLWDFGGRMGVDPNAD